MAEDHNPIFAYSTLMMLSNRLSEHADATLARRDVATDLRLAAHAIHQFGTLKFKIAHIAVRVDAAVQTATARAADYDSIVAALNGVGRELREAVAEAERDVGDAS